MRKYTDFVKVENDFEKKKLVNLGRFVDFLNRFEENLSSYQSVSIDYYLINKKTGIVICSKSVNFSVDEIKDIYYDICDILVKLADHDVVYYHESDRCISFDFYDDDSDDKYRVYAYLTCFKKEIYK